MILLILSRVTEASDTERKPTFQVGTQRNVVKLDP